MLLIKGKHQRLALILAAVAAMLGAALLAISALRDQAAYFYTPAQAREKHVEARRAIRLGGMVAPGSLKRAQNGVELRFVITDGKASVPARFAGIAPNLFREGSGVVAEGAFDEAGVFQATNLLAKHDERYMPREMEGIDYDPVSHEIKSPAS